jgi:hypothetical protein
MNKKDTLLRPNQIAKIPIPRRQVTQFILNYATTLQVIKSKTIGNFDVFMN